VTSDFGVSDWMANENILPAMAELRGIPDWRR
jgi:hypothetical protein